MAAISGIITFGLLVVLIDCLNGQNIPTHPDRMKIMAKGRAARIACNVDSSTLRSSAIHWYRVQPGGAFQRLMYFEAGKTNPKVDTGITYSGSVRNTQVSLTISKLQEDDAGSFFCALWTGDNTVMTVRGNRYKNLLSLSKRGFFWNNSSSKGETFGIFELCRCFLLSILH